MADNLKELKEELDEIKVELSRIAAALREKNSEHKYDWIMVPAGLITGMFIGAILLRALP